MDRLDRYVAAALLGAYFATLLFLVAMFTVFDLVFRIDTYIEAASSSGLGMFEVAYRIAQYELLAIPMMFVRVAPFVTVIASMFALTRLMSANEIVPMLFTGRWALRILQPMLVLSLVSALAMAATWEWVLPQTRDHYEDSRLFLRGRGGPRIFNSIAIRAPANPKLELFAQSYRMGERKLEGVVLYERGSVAVVGEHDGKYVGAAAAIWDPDKADWRLLGGREIVATAGGTEVRPRRYLGAGGITPALIVQSEQEKKDTSLLSFSELIALMKLRPDRTDYRLALHTHITAPLSNLVLLMLALPFALRFERGHRIESVLFAMLLCGLFLLMDITCQNFVYRGFLHPVVGAWSPTIVIGSLALVMFGSVKS